MLPCIIEQETAELVLDYVQNSSRANHASRSAKSGPPPSFPASVLGFTTSNLREVGGQSFRLAIYPREHPPAELPPSQNCKAVSPDVSGATSTTICGEDPALDGVTKTTSKSDAVRLRLRSGIYLVVVDDAHVGLSAAPPAEDVGANRMEVLLVKNSAGPGRGPKFFTERELESEVACSSVRFVQRLGDFSYLGVGPWLRDQILRHQDAVNAAWKGGISAARSGSSWSATKGVDLLTSADAVLEVDVVEATSMSIEAKTQERVRVDALGKEVVDELGLQDIAPENLAAYWTKHGGV
mmetsp:Transcript_8684/g.21008  ORF Transcript_8684/g.21008 Transcript_8684/m.21008 type:complete len:296 (-) Transcript_8684:223-1110(-)